jgi:hypothetical protein
LTFRPGTHGASEDDFTAVGFYRDPACVDLGAPPEGFLDLVLDFARISPRLEIERVDDALDAIDPADRPFRLVALIIPLYLPFECAIPCRRPPLYRCDGVARDLGIRPLVCPG